MPLKWYNHPKEFLEACGPFLEAHEMEHNMMLGNCYNAISGNKSLDGCYFLSSSEEGAIRDFSIKVSPKVILSCKNKKAVEAIYHFYQGNNIPFKGVIGDPPSSAVFAECSSLKVLQQKNTLVQGLSKVNELHLSQGTFEPCRLTDIPVLKKWAAGFLEEENLFPKRSHSEVETVVKDLMMQGNLFSWRHNGRVVSMSAIIRKTRHSSIIGFVYTPPEERGKGFGKSCVHQLSDYILRSGFKESGLLVYGTNTIARKIYEQIGYKTVSELLDIDFE